MSFKLQGHTGCVSPLRNSDTIWQAKSALNVTSLPADMPWVLGAAEWFCHLWFCQFPGTGEEPNVCYLETEPSLNVWRWASVCGAWIIASFCIVPLELLSVMINARRHPAIPSIRDKPGSPYCSPAFSIKEACVNAEPVAVYYWLDNSIIPCGANCKYQRDHGTLELEREFRDSAFSFCR